MTHVHRGIESSMPIHIRHHIMSAKGNLLDEGIVRYLRMISNVGEGQEQNFGEALRAWMPALPVWRESRLSSFA